MRHLAEDGLQLPKEIAKHESVVAGLEKSNRIKSDQLELAHNVIRKLERHNKWYKFWRATGITAAFVSVLEGMILAIVFL